jgi:hypothetical protein
MNLMAVLTLGQDPGFDNRINTRCEETREHRATGNLGSELGAWLMGVQATSRE